jgi:hypothetical protein
VLWADSDANQTGYVRLLSGATLCTTASTCASTNTGGGDIVIGGGAADLNNTARPAGPAVGSGSTYNTTGTSDTTGIQLGSLGVGSGGAKLYSAGGEVLLRGRMSPTPGNNWAAGISFVGGTEIYSGNGKINATGETTTAGGTDADGNMEFNAWGGGVTLTSLNTSSDAILIQATSSGAAAAYGIWGGNDGTRFNSAGGAIIRADYVEAGLDINFSVSGTVAIEPFGTALRDGLSNTTFAFGVGGANNFDFLGTPSAIRIGSASNSYEVELNTSFSALDKVEIIADDIDVTGNPTIRALNAGGSIVFKAKDWIDIRSGASTTTHPTIRTNNGDIILWSDADGNGLGSIFVGGFAELNSANGIQSKTASGGGRITIGGSFGNSGVDAQGHPLGAASDTGQLNGTASQLYALHLDASEIYSGGGDVTIRVESNAAQDGMHVNSGQLIWSGTGRINATVTKANSDEALKMLGSWVSAATLSPAISIATSVSGTLPGIYGVDGSSTNIASIATTGGGISISANVNAATNAGMSLKDANIVSRVGPITLTTNGQINWSTARARSLGASSSGDVTSSSADITIMSSAFLDDTANTVSTISTSGTVTIAPIGLNFNADVQTQFNVASGDFIFGNLATVDSASFTVKVSGDVTANGTVTIAGNAITL